MKTDELSITRVKQDDAFISWANARFVEQNKQKFQRGSEEHGAGFLSVSGLLNCLEEEVLDQWNYLQAIRCQMVLIPGCEILTAKERRKSSQLDTLLAGRTPGELFPQQLPLAFDERS